MKSIVSPTRTCQCPTCGGQAAVPVVQSSPPADNLDFESLNESWFGFFKKKVFFTYSRCASCGQLYSPRYFTDEALARLYSSMPDNTAGIGDTNLIRTQAAYFEHLISLGVPKGDYFELGPDIGLLTQIAARRMRGSKLWLYEPNVSVHAELASRTEGCAHEIHTEMHDFSAVPDGSIGVCVAIHVVDHLPDAHGVMTQLVRKLRHDGVLLIVTHDERSLLARVLGRRWPAYCLQHPHLFNSESITKFMASCGLEVVRVVKTVNYFPAFYLFRHLCYALGIQSAKSWTARGPVLPLKLGNIATLVRKIQ